MTEQEEMQKFFVPGLAEKLNYKFLSAMGKKEDPNQRKNLPDQIQQCRTVFTAQVGMPHPYFPEDPEDCVRFILPKDEVYKIFVCTPRHIVIDIHDVFEAAQFTE